VVHLPTWSTCPQTKYQETALSHSGLVLHLLGRNPSTRPLENFSSLASSLIIATMACKFMVNSAFEARLLLQPSHQRTVLIATVNKLGCPIPGRPMLPLILSSRSYSESTPTPPFPKTSGSTEGSESSGPEDKNSFFRKGWGKVWDKVWAGTKTGGLAITGLVLADSLICAILYMLITKGAHYICHPVNLARLVPTISETRTRICTRICNLR